jgi:sigma-B regulation protein RsbU (phosphoserine phosphatase)
MFLVGDVSDKGAAAALFMAKTVTLANLLGRERIAPGELLARLNRELCHDNDSCMFVTAICGVLDPASGEVTYANAGHNPPLLCSPGNHVRYLEVPPGTALGVFEEADYASSRIALAPGESLLLYTDGVTEAVNDTQELFGEERLESLPLGLFDTSRAMVEGIVRAVEEFAEGVEQADDITVLALTRTVTLPLQAETRMTGGVSAIATTQAWLVSRLRRAGVDADLVGDIDVVADEILANIVHHAWRDREHGEARIQLVVDEAAVTVSFSDDGPAYDPLVEADTPDLDLPTEDREIGGLGIHMVKALMDRVSYRRENGRNVLEVEKRRDGT